MFRAQSCCCLVAGGGRTMWNTAWQRTHVIAIDIDRYRHDIYIYIYVYIILYYIYVYIYACVHMCIDRGLTCIYICIYMCMYWCTSLRCKHACPVHSPAKIYALLGCPATATEVSCKWNRMKSSWSELLSVWTHPTEPACTRTCCGMGMCSSLGILQRQDNKV